MTSHLASLAFFFLLVVTSAHAQFPIVKRVTKDAATRQYVLELRRRANPVAIRTVVDLGGSFIWLDFDCGRVGIREPCNSARCTAADTGACLNGTICSFIPNNPFSRVSTSGELSTDEFDATIILTDRLLFGCAPPDLVQGLARGTRGITGLGRNAVAYPSQLTAGRSLPRRFALCLSKTVGPAFFGGGSYRFLPNIDLTSSLVYTPLLVNPVSLRTGPAGQASDEYFMGVTSVKVNGTTVARVKAVSRSTGRGGTRISTVEPYTVLESSIFRAVSRAFAREGGLRTVPAVKPFGFCFDSSTVGRTAAGPVVPPIDLVLQSGGPVWRILGHNSVVEVSRGVSCLAFVVAGPFQSSAIVLGGHQLEDNLVEFDLAASRLGFSSSLLGRQTACANFRFSPVDF